MTIPPAAIDAAIESLGWDEPGEAGRLLRNDARDAVEAAAPHIIRAALDDLEARIRQKFLCFDCGCSVCMTLPTEAELIVGMIREMREGLQ